MKILIVEDEKLSAEHLTNLLSKIEPEYKIIHVAESIKRTVDFLNSGVKVDLIFMDIHLADGISFDIFKTVKSTAPIIFTTAFEEYAIRAFKVNSIDYLLKPIGRFELQEAVAKFKLTTRSSDQLTVLEDAYNIINRQYKNRFLVKSGEQILTISVDEITFLIAEDGIVLLVNKEGRRFAIDHSLDVLESMLDPKMFFRINRKVIIQVDAIGKIVQHLNSRLKITANFLDSDASIVSRERVAEFKLWLDR